MKLDQVLSDKPLSSMQEKYPDREVYNKPSYGFEKVSRKVQSISYPTIAVLDAAMDLLDEGRTLREVSEWMISVYPSHPLSHMGLKNIWFKERPDNPLLVSRKKEVVRQQKARKVLTRAERMERDRRKKISHEKRRINFAKARIEKIQEEVSLLSGTEKKTTVLEIDYSLLSQEDVSEETQNVEPVFKPNPGPQTEFLSASQFEVLYGGAAGGGKSFALLADPMRWFSNKNFNGLLLRRTNDELRDLKWKSQELYKQAFPDAVWREKDSEWRFPSGARLWMSYLERDEDVMRYQGQAFTWVGFDELTQYSTPFAWNYLRGRLRTHDPELKQNLALRGTTNPGGPGHGWVKKMFIDPAPAGESFWATDIDSGETMRYPKGHEKEGQPLFRRRFIPANLYDNPHLAKDGNYETTLLSLPEQQRRQLLEGDWDVADGAAFQEFRRSIHVVEPFDIPKTWRRFRSCDYGYSSFSAVHWYAVDPEGTLYVYRELYVTKMEADELARLVISLEKGERIDYGVLDSSLWSRRGDPGPSIAERMIRAGCKWRPSDRSPGSRIAGRNRLHELLKVRDLGNGEERPGIVFFSSCRQIVSDLPILPSDPKGSDDIDSRYASDHAYDSLRYGIMTRPRAMTAYELMGHGKTEQHKPSSDFFGY